MRNDNVKNEAGLFKDGANPVVSLIVLVKMLKQITFNSGAGLHDT